MMQRPQYRCMVFNQIGLKLVCSAKSYLYRSSILFSDKEATGRMVSHNKEADQIVKTQNFLAFPTTQIYRLQFQIKTLKANKNGEDHGCIAYIPNLDVVETRDIILSNNIFEAWVCRLNCITIDCLSLKNSFSRVEPYRTYKHCISVYKLFLS